MLAESGEQMTTDRTAIRRWLAVGGSTHRPPWRARKARHRPIVAPLAITLAATAAIGLGVALARTGEERPAGRRRRSPGSLGLDHDEALADGLRRMALEQADVVIVGLADADHGDARRAVHEARKAIKRLRTIVGLLEGQLGRGGSARERDALSGAASLLAGARDAEVMLNTLEGLLARHSGQLAGKAGVASLRLQLAHDRDQAERRVLEPGNRLRVGDELRLFRGRAASWQLLERPGTGLVEDGLSRVYRQGRKRFRRAAAKRGGRMRTMHQWRKRVKDLRYSAEALQREMPAGRPRRKASGPAATARAEAKWLRRLGRRADALGEVLGEEHDLAVLGEWIAAHGAGAGVGRATRRRLLKLIARRRRKLRRRALRAGRELYARKPARFVRRAAKAYRRSSPALSRR
jgi:CHAD domain-containing protein